MSPLNLSTPVAAVPVEHPNWQAALWIWEAELKQSEIPIVVRPTYDPESRLFYALDSINRDRGLGRDTFAEAAEDAARENLKRWNAVIELGDEPKLFVDLQADEGSPTCIRALQSQPEVEEVLNRSIKMGTIEQPTGKLNVYYYQLLRCLVVLVPNGDRVLLIWLYQKHLQSPGFSWVPITRKGLFEALSPEPDPDKPVQSAPEPISPLQPEAEAVPVPEPTEAAAPPAESTPAPAPKKPRRSPTKPIVLVRNPRYLIVQRNSKRIDANDNLLPDLHVEPIGWTLEHPLRASLWDRSPQAWELSEEDQLQPGEFCYTYGDIALGKEMDGDRWVRRICPPSQYRKTLENAIVQATQKLEKLVEQHLASSGEAAPKPDQKRNQKRKSPPPQAVAFQPQPESAPTPPTIDWTDPSQFCFLSAEDAKAHLAALSG